MTEKLTAPLGEFKEREIEIVSLMAEGLSNAEIADKLFITKETIRWYNKQIYSKLGTSRRIEAIALAREMGLIEGAAVVSPPPLAPFLRKHNLPTIATPFLGRDREIADLKERLIHSNTPLVTILAPGGMGKTRLSIELAHQLLDSFADGAYLFELAPLNKANDIVKTALSALGLSEKKGVAPEEILFNACRGKKMLLVFDNFEELLDGASFISNLIRNLPDARVIVTSRERLNLHGEMVYELRGLLESGAALFEATAKVMHAHFEMQEGDKAAVRGIVSFVGGLPLAIILAASWVDSLSIPEIAEEVQNSLDLLETEMHDIPQRQQSIRGVLAASWQKLTPKEQAIGMKLAIFKGGFSRGAAAKVVQASLPILRKLQHRSLVQRVADRRYDLHPLIRQFGLEQLEAGRLLDETHQHHLAYFQQHIEETLEALDHGDFVYSLNQVELEHDNVRLALDWGIGQGGGANVSALTLTMVRYWDHRTYPQEALHYLSQALSVTSDKRQQLQLRIERNRFLVIISRAKEAEADGRAILQEAVIVGDEGLKIRAIHQLVFTLSILEIRDLALVQQYVELSKEAGDLRHLVRASISLSNLYSGLGQTEQAFAITLEALQLARELEDDGLVARLSYNAGLSLLEQNDVEQAKPLLAESLALKKLIGDRAGTASRLGVLSKIAILEHRFQDAEAYLAEGFATIKSVEGEVPRRKILLLGQKGYWYQAQSLWREALKYQKEALALAHETDNVFFLVDIQVSLAFVYTKAGIPNQAQHFLRQAISLAQKHHLLIFYEDLLFVAAFYYEARSDFNKSAEVYFLLIAGKPLPIFSQKDLEALKQSLQTHIFPDQWEEIGNNSQEQRREDVLSQLFEALSNEEFTPSEIKRIT